MKAFSARRASGRLLRRKRAHVRKQSRAVARTLSRTLATPGQGPAAATHDIAALRKTLQGLRHDVRKSGTAGHGRQVAAALDHLDGSLDKLAGAGAESDPQQAMDLLAQGMKQLEAARREAGKAGHDWAL